MLKWLHKSSILVSFLFLIHTDVTAVTIQAKEIISNEVKEKALLEQSYGKEGMLWPTQQ